MVFKRYPLLCFIPVLIQSILFAVNDTLSSFWPGMFGFLIATGFYTPSSAAFVAVFSEVLMPALVIGLSIIFGIGALVGIVAAIKQTYNNHQSEYFGRYACENTANVLLGTIPMPMWKE